MNYYDEKRKRLYCSKKCAKKDRANEEDLISVSAKEILDDEANVCDDKGEPILNKESRFWYCQEEGVTSPMFGQLCDCETPYGI